MRRLLVQFPVAGGILGLGLLLGSDGHSATESPTTIATSEQVFEIRTYTTHEGRLDDLHRRFRDHTLELFERHGMTNVSYWVPQDPPLSENTLIFVLAHPSREAAERSWEAFLADPDWHAARDASEEPGPMLQQFESVFVDATDYSPLQ